MKASEFEYRHQTLVHAVIATAAFATYLRDPDDIVWKFVKDSTAPRLWERTAFLVATILIGVGAAICTTAAVRGRRVSPRAGAGAILYAIGLASLAPLSGFIILVVGEAVRVLRVVARKDEFEGSMGRNASELKYAFRQQAAKWGIFLTMIIFTFTLKDGVAEALAAVSVIVWALLNFRGFIETDTAA